MKTILAAAVLTPMFLAGAHIAQAADLGAEEPVVSYEEPDDRGGVRIGVLTCDIGGGLGYVLGSAKEVECVFKSSVGSRRSESYSGALRKFGVDLGYTSRGTLVWAVFAPTAGYHRGSLGGIYQGATVEATIGGGVGGNVLLGGTSGSIMLQTISVTGQLGLNVAATGTSMTLNPN